MVQEIPLGIFCCYNELMNKCNCNKSGLFSDLIWATPSCETQPNTSCGLRSISIPANRGTDAAGQPYEPKLGAWTCTIVTYKANGAVYIYDSEGVFTKIGGTSTPTPPEPTPTGPLTAAEYDGLGLTAAQYDARKLTASAYDNNAKKYLTV